MGLNIRDFFNRIDRSFTLFRSYVATHSGIIIRNVFIILLIFISVFLIVALLVFWTVKKSPPQVVVPELKGKELMEGLLVLQDKNLGAVIDPRYFSDYQKNIIVEQEPAPGSIVREGKDIRLIVSKGPIISIVEDFTGKTITYVRNRLQEIFSFQGKTIKLGNITYVTSEYPQGTIVGQYPPPNTPITGVENIDLIVSRGKIVQEFILENYTGGKITEVMEKLAFRGVLVNVVTEEVQDPAQNGIIVSQIPEAGTVVGRNDTVTFTVGYLPSEQMKDELYARVLNLEVPVEHKEVNVRIVVKDRIGEREIYNAVTEGGKNLQVPFKSYFNTVVYIYINGELYEMRKLD